jgi:hypothetical protein
MQTNLKNKSFYISGFILFVFVFNLLSPMIVLADDLINEMNRINNLPDTSTGPTGVNGPSGDTTTRGINTGGQSTGANRTADDIATQQRLSAMTETDLINNNFGKQAADSGLGIGEAAIGALGTCTIGAILSRFLTTLIGVLVNMVIDKIKGAITDTVDNLLTLTAVPVADNKTRKNTCATAMKTTGICHTTITGLLDWVGNISLDSIMFCIVNEILTYVTESTIRWINNGFNGNPVYVQNPGAMFKQMADREIVNLGNQIMGQVADGAADIAVGTIIQIAEPLRQGAVRAIIGSPEQNFQQSVRSTMSPRIEGNYDAYVSGDEWPGFGGFMEISNNNYFETNMKVMAERDRRIAQAQENERMKLQYSGGYRTPVNCPENHLRQDGTCDPMYAQSSIPYRAIGDEVQSRANMKYLRASFAKDFDSVITALVNQLIKISVTKIYQGIGSIGK